jgi:hypothetical protein
MAGTTSIPGLARNLLGPQRIGPGSARAQFAYIDFVRGGREDLREVQRAQRRSLAKTLVDFEKAFDDRREAVARAAYLSGSHTLREIAAHFRVHYTTVRRAVRRERQLRAETACKRQNISIGRIATTPREQDPTPREGDPA